MPVKYFFYAQHEFSPLFLNTIEEMKEYFLILLALSIFFDWFGYINMKSVDIKLCVCSLSSWMNFFKLNLELETFLLQFWVAIKFLFETFQFSPIFQPTSPLINPFCLFWQLILSILYYFEEFPTFSPHKLRLLWVYNIFYFR